MKPARLWYRYVRVCEELVEWWEPGRYGSAEGVSPICAMGEPVAYVEHVLHELGHATSLGLPLDDVSTAQTPGKWLTSDLLSQRIARRVSAYDTARRTVNVGLSPRELRAEAWAWAVEYVCWRRLRMHFTVHDARRGAMEQGVPRTMIDLCLGRPRHARHATAALAWLERQRVAYAAGARRRHDKSLRVDYG